MHAWDSYNEQYSNFKFISLDILIVIILLKTGVGFNSTKVIAGKANEEHTFRGSNTWTGREMGYTGNCFLLNADEQFWDISRQYVGRANKIGDDKLLYVTLFLSLYFKIFVGTHAQIFKPKCHKRGYISNAENVYSLSIFPIKFWSNCKLCSWPYSR